MGSLLTVYVTLICTSAVLSLYLGFYAFIKRHNYTAIVWFFIFNSAFNAVYCFASAFGLLSTSIEQVKFWVIFQYIGIAFAPPLGLLFIMKYVGIKITKKKIIALLTIPSITMFMVITNDLHHLHYRVIEFDRILGAPYVYQEIGTWYMIHGVFIFSCMFVAFLIALSYWKETSKSYRPQLVSLMFGQLVPMVTAFLYLVGLTPPGIDPVPMVLWLYSLLYFWAISTSRLFTILPIAKDAIFHSINDGVIVLDDLRRVVEFNRSATMMFPKLKKSMFGSDFNEVWVELTGTSPSFTWSKGEITAELKYGKCIYQLRTSLLQQGNTNGLLLIFTDISELKRLQEKLEYQAYYDELTKIYNRRAFFQKCEQQFRETKNELQRFTIILMDIDYFKKVNDTFGHHVGDQLLVHVAKTIQSQLRSGELFARYGGEEFVIAINELTLREAEKLADHLRSFMEANPLKDHVKEISVTLSLGVAQIVEEENIYDLLNRADKALYKAKQSGRNQVQIYQE